MSRDFGGILVLSLWNIEYPTRSIEYRSKDIWNLAFSSPSNLQGFYISQFASPWLSVL
ncbi:MAG: hypothetical protein HWN79_18790 [Candidatus Lokiarchaeota archaeon]|nr:hypothetical protein [Candidatus Lokiarchaeota archaeon]